MWGIAFTNPAFTYLYVGLISIWSTEWKDILLSFKIMSVWPLDI